MVAPEVDGSEPRDLPEAMTSQQMDMVLLRLEAGVEHALHRAKVWSKYAKVIQNYVERRATLEQEYAKSLAKLAQTCRAQLNEEVSKHKPVMDR